ncbi:MAG: tRNA modification GTPase [Myxococcales bacterium]|nr:tRNA modification GTPase [Myxococcales bacterium]
MTRTIAAVATPPGNGGVGIVRLSGPRAGEIVAAMIGRTAAELEDRRLVRGVARAPGSGERLDEVLAVIMRGPRSYTGEDVGELHGHGGAQNVARLLAAVLAAGAQPAEPGEFTRRAFENGRIDLSRAEAVAAVIGAASERALRAAQTQLAGALGARVAAEEGRVLELLAEVEAAIDFPDEALVTSGRTELAAAAARLAEQLRTLARSHGEGRALAEGITVVLVGATNVGKSSLLNALLGEERVLVSSNPGTTRDYVEVRMEWNGFRVTVVDTAGERSAGERAAGERAAGERAAGERADVVACGDAGAAASPSSAACGGAPTEVDARDLASADEARGIELGRARAVRADVVVRVHDAAVVRGTAGCASAAELEVWNKADLAAPPEGTLGVSARTGAGLDELRQAILARVVGAPTEGDESGVVTTERQRAALSDAADALARGAAAAVAGRSSELVAADLRVAATALARIRGIDVGEGVLDQIFARFCIGK